MKPYFFLFSSAFLLSLSSFSQKNDTLKTEDIEIINVYEPVISDVFKTLETPKIVDTIPPPVNVRYDLLKRQLKTEFHIDTIKAATMKSESLPKLYRSHVKLGAGNNFITFADASFHNLRSREQSYGARLKHYSAYNPVKKSPLSGFSESGLNVYGTKFLTDFAVSGEVEHHRNVIHYYGLDSSFSNSIVPTDSGEIGLGSNGVFYLVNKSTLRQRYAKTSANASVVSFFKDSSATNYVVALNYYNLVDLYKTQENNFLLNADFQRFYGKENIRLSTSFDFNNYKNDLIIPDLSNGILKIHPHIISNGKTWLLNVGLGLFGDFTRSARFSFKPIAELRYHIVSDLIIPYVGINGNIGRNSYKLFCDENPFLIPSVQLLNSNRTDVYAGVRGAESSEISFNLAGTLSQVKNMPFYVLDTLFPIKNKFSVIYDDVDISNIRAEISYEKNEKLKFIFRGDYFSYQPVSEKFAWHMPQLKGNISVTYNLRDKIILKTDVFGISEQFARSYDSLATGGVTPIRLDGIIDGNLGIEYRYNHRLSAFLNLNNLGAVRYYRWQNYPTMRFNVLGGISYSF